MKTPKFNIGDIVSYRFEGDTVIAKITSIIIDENEDILYGFDSIDNAQYEEDVKPYEISKEEKSEKPGLPKTYKEALQLFDGDIYYNEYDIVDSVYSRRIEDEEFNHPYSISKETAEKIITFEKLIFLRDIYRQGWKPDWKNLREEKYSVVVAEDNVNIVSGVAANRVLSFRTADIRDLFLKNFKDLIEECKEFI